MPDPKDKYSDQNLDPADQAYKELVDAKADDGDAVAHDLRRSEEGLGVVQRRLQRRDNKQQAAREAEAADWNNPENKFYKPTKKTQARISNWSNKRKTAVVGGGVAGIIGIISLFFMLLPMKVPGILSLVTQQAGQRLEQVTENRAKLILGRAILTKFGTNTGVVLTGEGAFKTLVASMRTSGFEKRLERKGLKITPTPDGVKLSFQGKDLKNGQTFKNEKAIIDALEGNKLTNKMLKDVIKEDIPSWRWMKRAKFAKWLRIKYGIPRYGLPNSDKSTEEERKKDTDTYRAKAAHKRTIANFTVLVSCFMSGTCDKINSTGEASKTSQSDAAGTAAQLEAAALDVETDVAEDGLQAVTEKMPKLLLNLFGSKAIPIIGWIDLVATIDHFVYATGNDDYIGKVAAYFKGAAYAGIFADWAGYASQGQLGTMDPEYMGVLAQELDGAEMAQIFQAYEGNSSKGVPIETIVGSDKPSEFSTDFKKFVDSDKGTVYKQIGHPLMNAYYETIGGGGFLGWVSGMTGDLIGGVFGHIFGPLSDLLGGLVPETVTQAAKDALASIGEKIMDMFGLSIDPLETGPKLMNNIGGGAEVSFNDYCKEIGCRRLSDSETALQNSRIAKERNDYLEQKSLVYKLFSSEEPSSVTSQIATKLPTTSTTSLASIGRIVSGIPSSITTMFMPKSSATSYTNLYGVALFGATTKDLALPLSGEFLAGDSCPEVAEGEFNNCLIEKVTAEAMLCEFQPEITECLDSDPVSKANAGGANFRISSFNIYYSSNDRSPEYSIRMWEERLARSSRVIKENGLEVVGLQEVRENQWRRIQDNDMLGGQYDIYPKNYAAGGYGSQNPIVWDINVFELVEGKPIPGYQVLGPKNSDANIQVKLRYKETGQEIYVINHHDPVGKGVSIKARYDSAIERRAYVKDLMAKEKIPVFLTGDFNSGYDHRPPQPTYLGDRNNLAYCIFTANDLMWDAYDAAKNKKGQCPSTDGQGVDHIFMSTNVKAKNYDYSISPRGNGSDVHNTLYVDVEVPGSGAALGGLTVGTYNVKVPGQTDGPNDGWLHSTERMPLIAEVVKENEMDVVGFQEVEPSTFKLLSDNMPEYDSYPKNAASAVGKSWMDPVFWLKNSFDLVAKGEFKRSYRMCPGVQLCEDAVWVRLREKSSSNEFYFMSLHMVNRNPYVGPNKSDNGGAEKREADSKEVVRVIQEEFEQGIPVFFVGDLNSSWDIARTGDDAALNGNRNRLPYCILTKNDLLINSYDNVDGKSGHCPSPGRPYEIDHIYTTPDIKFHVAKQIKNEKTAKASDHDPIIARIPSGGNGNNAGGDWSWPLDKKWWENYRSDFLDAHGNESSTFTSPSVVGTASDISAPVGGEPIYSMLAGKVIRKDTCAIEIESTTSYGVMRIAYAHSTNHKIKLYDTVKSGQQLSSVGTTCNSTGAHLHIDMALDKKHICPQDVFIAISQGNKPNLKALTTKGTGTCAGRN